MDNTQPTPPAQPVPPADPNQPHEIKLESLQTAINPTAPMPAPAPMPEPTPVAEPTPAPPAPVPAPTPAPMPVSAEPAPSELDKQLEQSLSQIPDAAATAAGDPKKKYLIAGIVGVAVIVLGFVLYKVFIPGEAPAAEETAEVETTNTLSFPEEESSEKLEELEEVVDDLEDIYSTEEPEVFEDAVLEEIPAEGTAETEGTAEAEAETEASTDGKVERTKK